MERITDRLLVSWSVDLSSFGYRHRDNSILPSNFTAPGAKFLKFRELFQVLRVYFCNAQLQDIKSSFGDLKNHAVESGAIRPYSDMFSPSQCGS